jgi:predicted N-acetyltransferase YhbS
MANETIFACTGLPVRLHHRRLERDVTQRDKMYTISNLRDQPHLAEAATDRIWSAWWREKDYPIGHVRELVDQNLYSNGLPLALVAHEGNVFIGTVSVIENDMDERPEYSPWVAALWVEPANRKSGIGSALVRAATEAAFEQGVSSVFLCASVEISPFYKRLGCTEVEQNVLGMNVLAFKRSALNC